MEIRQRAILLPKVDDSGNLTRSDAVVFDAVFEERHQSDLELTENPVETGVVVSDHAFMKPKRLSVFAGVSNSPLRELPSDRFASDSGRAQAAYEFLCQMQKQVTLFDVQTGLKLYRDMVCTSIEASQDKDTASALFFKAELREVQIVSTQTIKYPPRKAGATHRQASKRQDAGEQQAKEVAVKSSLLAKFRSIMGEAR